MAGELDNNWRQKMFEKYPNAYGKTHRRDNLALVVKSIVGQTIVVRVMLLLRAEMGRDVTGARWLNWLQREFTDRKVRGWNPTSASRLSLFRLGQPGSIPALVLPSGGMAARHR
ncbi:hypothetical protein CSKR_111353, partial [Clonorchis sinensis]